jgi:hypothetical protein
MGTYDRIAELPLRVESYELEGLAQQYGSFERHTTVFHLQGAGEEGLGEDVNWSADDQRAQQEHGPVLALAGEWTLDGFARHLETVDLFPTGGPAYEAWAHYRRWALESAALDLALRQAGRSLAAVLDRIPRPVTFVVSIGLGSPPSLAPVERRLTAYPGTRFKLDSHPDWTDELIAQVAATGSVDVVDFKGAYKGLDFAPQTDAGLYARVAAAFPDAWLEDPDLDDDDAAAALAPHHERITWDSPIHSVDDVLALPYPPRALNVKPSRFGALRTLLDFYDHCADEDILLYGGGQAELGPGRGQAQYLAALFHPDAPNDIAPPGWDRADFPETGLTPGPLDPAPEPTGFRRRA